MKTIKQTVHIHVKPEEVYEAYVDAKKHGEFIGSKVVFENKVGGKFSAWDGELAGENLELVKGKKIVQKWRADDWPEGHYSKLTIELRADGDGTKLTLAQVDVPDDKVDDIDSGWHEYYWEPMKEYFGK
jgi:activator of HSP90 ATPase